MCGNHHSGPVCSGISKKLEKGFLAGSVETNVTGTSAIIGAVVPLPFIARVESTACRRLADQLQVFFKGGTAAR